MDSWTPLWGWDVPPKKKKSSSGKEKATSSSSDKKGKKKKLVDGGAEKDAVPLQQQEKYKGATVEEIKDEDE